MRWESHHSRATSASGTVAARASRRPGCAHQPPSGPQKASQEVCAVQAAEAPHCQARRSSAA
ncbi:hypothetical protein ACFRKE_28025, partial [Kitasatospora indigofera]|uniref:hypothetical protein n=1 Tax=Kitasatospora indigofera TaxID=67307 RepID=UPI0036C91D81